MTENNFRVRGTKFYFKESPENSCLCVCDGSVEVKALQDASNKITNVVAGFDLSFKPGDKTLSTSKASEQMMSMAKQGFVELGFPVK